jgi:hypothetical protein
MTGDPAMARTAFTVEDRCETEAQSMFSPNGAPSCFLPHVARVLCAALTSFFVLISNTCPSSAQDVITIQEPGTGAATGSVTIRVTHDADNVNWTYQVTNNNLAWWGAPMGLTSFAIDVDNILLLTSDTDIQGANGSSAVGVRQTTVFWDFMLNPLFPGETGSFTFTTLPNASKPDLLGSGGNAYHCLDEYGQNFQCSYVSTPEPGTGLYLGYLDNGAGVGVSGTLVGPAHEPDFSITTPDDESIITLSTGFRTTPATPFTATSIDTADPIAWTLHLEYTRTNGSKTFSNDRTFSTVAGSPSTQTYTGMGGQLSVTASQTSNMQEITVFITVVSIPDADITNQLMQLYADGATPNLMTGIAEMESIYQQFANRSLYGISALWPYESLQDGGSHVGLMQMPLSMSMAWDWLANTSGGVNLFRQKLASAKRVEQRIRRSFSGLRALNPQEEENMALVLYGPYAPTTAKLTGQYYVPQCVGGVANGHQCKDGMWDWVVNVEGNPLGVQYADSVRSKVM